MVVAGLSAVTALLYFLPFILRFAFVWVWSFILFVLWIVVFGIFGQVCPISLPPDSFLLVLLDVR